MTPPTFLLYVMCLFVANMAHLTQRKKTSLHFKSANVGESVTLECICEDNAAVMLYWYRQLLGKRPILMSTFYSHNANGTFQDEFKDTRFSLDTEKKRTNLLKISHLRVSDSATYYCVMSNLYDFKFCEGTTVSVKTSGLNIQALVQQSPSETIQPRGSETLTCTVHTGTCDEERSVYWFKDSRESHPGFIYTHAGRNDQCEREINTQTHTCVYNLPEKSLNQSHNENYYCAVASCGHILFGDGTKRKDEVKLAIVHVLSGVLALTIILAGLLACSMYKMSKRHQRCAAILTPKRELFQDGENRENLHYAALSDYKRNRSRKKTNDTDNECVYTSVKK